VDLLHSGPFLSSMPFRITPFVLILFSTLVSAENPLPLADAQRSLNKGDLNVAEHSVRTYLATHKDSADAHFLLGYILFRKNDPKSSLAEYTEGARFRKPTSYDLETVGGDYVLLKDYADADKWFSKSVEFDPSNVSALYYLGRTKYNENRFAEAIAIFQNCLKIDPKNVKYEDNLGLSYQGLGRNDEAAAAFREALDWDKSSAAPNPGPYLDLGILLLDTGHAADAIPLLEKAVQLTPKDLRAHTQLGKAYLHSDQLEKAQTELEAAVQLDSRNAPTRFMLAQVYRKRGLLDKARRETEAYAALNGEHSTDKAP
jgi:tetratricopeptide (TPR) repeat protein